MVEIIWRQFHQQLLVFIYSKVNDHAIAEDILQEVFIKVYQKIERLTDKDKLQPWLYQICRNTIIDFYRSKKLVILNDSLSGEIAEEQTPQDQAQLNRCITLLITNLPDKYNDILMRNDLHGEKQQEIAKLHNLTIAAVKSRVIRGREQLKNKLQACCDWEFNELGLEASCKSNCGCEK